MSYNSSNIVDVTCIVTRETEKAFCVDAAIGGAIKAIWLPKSLCEWDENDRTMAMPEWLAKDKGLI